MRTAIASGHPKPSRVTEDDVRAPFARWFEHSKSQEVARANQERACTVHRFRNTAKVLDVTVDIWVLHEHTTEVRRDCLILKG